MVSASSFFSGLDPYHAFDGFVAGTGVYWIGTGGGVDWLQLDCGYQRSALVTSYAIQVNSIPEPLRAPKNFTLQGSNDGSAWTVLDTQTNQTGWTSNETRTFTVSGVSTYYRFIRLNITANNGDATYTQVAELYLYGPAAAAAPNQPCFFVYM